MSTSFGAQPSGLISKSEYLSSLPRWRRWLSRFNWHPVVELEIREIERKQRMKQLESEIAQIEKETEQLQKENGRLAQINSRLERFEREHLSGSTPPPSTDLAGGSPA